MDVDSEEHEVMREMGNSKEDFSELVAQLRLDTHIRKIVLLTVRISFVVLADLLLNTVKYKQTCS